MGDKPRKLQSLRRDGSVRQTKIEIDVLEIARRQWPALFENEKLAEPAKILPLERPEK